jgi:hypothetical protein
MEREMTSLDADPQEGKPAGMRVHVRPAVFQPRGRGQQGRPVVRGRREGYGVVPLRVVQGLESGGILAEVAL